MLYEVLGNKGETLVRADQRLHACPFAFKPFLLGLGLVLCQFRNFSVNLWLLVLVEFDPCETAQRPRRVVIARLVSSGIRKAPARAC